MNTPEINALIAWLKKRAQPDSGIRYEGASYDFETDRSRQSRVELHGEDANFVAKNFHGRGAGALAIALEQLLDDARRLADLATENSAEIVQLRVERNGLRGQHVTIEHDGFTGTIIGEYTTLEGKHGVNVQLDGAKVVHVYGMKWIEDQLKERNT